MVSIVSRSYRKHPILTDPSTNHRYKPRPKAIANRSVRRQFNQELKHKTDQNDLDSVASFGHALYKRQYPSWDIVDYRSDLRSYTNAQFSSLSEKSIRIYYGK